MGGALRRCGAISYSYAYGERDVHPHPNGHSHPNGHGYVHTFFNVNRYAFAHSLADINANPNPCTWYDHSNFDSHINNYKKAKGYCNSNYPNNHTLANCNPKHFHANGDTLAHRDLAIKLFPLRNIP